MCGQGCRYEEGREECNEIYVDKVSHTPEESCNLTPIKTCHKVTPLLSTRQECSVVPHQVCSLGVNKSVKAKPVNTKWCNVYETDISALNEEESLNGIASVPKRKGKAVDLIVNQKMKLEHKSKPNIFNNPTNKKDKFLSNSGKQKWRFVFLDA